MGYCSDCGCGTSNGLCSNCDEEAYIFENQSEYMDDEISEEFAEKASEQFEKKSKD